jgi:chromosome segregation ATPase
MLVKQKRRACKGRETERALWRSQALSRGLAEIRKEIPRLGRVEEELVSRQAEDQRLSEMLLAMRQSLNNVSKDLDERTRTLPYMVEQRALDNKRIAQLQAEHVEVLKRTDALASKPPVLEERIGRLEKELQRIQPIPDQLRNDQQAFLESQRVADVDRSRQVAAWESEFIQQREIIEKQVVRLRAHRAYDAAGRHQDLEEFQASMIESAPNRCVPG